MIIAKTVKGKGVPFVENQNGWHGKALDDDELAKALDPLLQVLHIVEFKSFPKIWT